MPMAFVKIDIFASFPGTRHDGLRTEIFSEEMSNQVPVIFGALKHFKNNS